MAALLPPTATITNNTTSATLLGNTNNTLQSFGEGARTPNNISSFPPRFPCGNLKFNPSYHITSVVIAFFIVTINLLVLFLISRNKKLRRTPANYLLLSFSCNDIINGLSIIIHIIPYFYLTVNGCMDFLNTFTQKYMITSHMLSYLLLLNAVGHLLMLSSERFISLYHALRLVYFTFYCWSLLLLCGSYLIKERNSLGRNR